MTVGTVLIDMDGTLSDSAPGILGSLRRALDDLGLPRIDGAVERSVLGPPFAESLPPLVGADHVDAVIERYRTHYATGMFDTRPYDGVADVLADLRPRGITLAVATSKPEFYAVPIVEHLGMAGMFATIGGDALDGSLATKALVIGEVLHRLGDPDPDTVLMIGDRAHDVVGARAHGVDCLGAGWGYGAPGELATAGALDVFERPAQLRAALDRLLQRLDDAATA